MATLVRQKIAFAQHYFAVQTRRFEKIIERMENTERIESRGKLKESEKEFGRVVYDRGVGSQDFGLLKSKGDHAFFGGHTTQDMKRKLNVPKTGRYMISHKKQLFWAKPWQMQ